MINRYAHTIPLEIVVGLIAHSFYPGKAAEEAVRDFCGFALQSEPPKKWSYCLFQWCLQWMEEKHRLNNTTILLRETR